MRPLPHRREERGTLKVQRPEHKLGRRVRVKQRVQRAERRPKLDADAPVRRADEPQGANEVR